MSAVDARFRHLVRACIPIFFFTLSGWIRGSYSLDPIDQTEQFDDGAFPLVGCRHRIAPDGIVRAARGERIGADLGIVAVVFFRFPPSRRAADVQVSRQ